MLSFKKWASVDFGPVAISSCVVQTAPILVGSTRPVFALSARLTVGDSKARTASARARTWLIGLCPVWDLIGIPHDPVPLSTRLLRSQKS